MHLTESAAYPPLELHARRTFKQSWYARYLAPHSRSYSAFFSAIARSRSARSRSPVEVEAGAESGGETRSRYDLNQWLKHVSYVVLEALQAGESDDDCASASERAAGGWAAIRKYAPC